MNITLSDEEISQFPVEIKEFIVGYVKQRLEESGEKPPELATHENPYTKKVWDEEAGGYIEVSTPESRLHEYLEENLSNEIFYWDYHIDDGSTYGKWSPDDRLLNPQKYKYGDLQLIASSKFDWYEAFSSAYHQALVDPSLGDHVDYELSIKGDSFEIVSGRDLGDWAQSPSELAIPIIHLFLCLFGFGGILKNMSPATTPKEFINNIRLTGCEVKNPRSSGPYLKTLTTYIREKMLSDGYGIRFPVSDRGWFDIKKSTNEFYFEGSTRDNCMNACKTIVSDLAGVSLDELGDKKYKLVPMSPAIVHFPPMS
jgi:hypothetical protein